MPRASQENKIIEAALECFGELGYEGTRIKHIASKAGVAESALYRHYASKEAIARSLFVRYVNAYAARLTEIVNSTDSIEARLKNIVLSSLSEYEANADIVSYIMLQPPCFHRDLPADLVSPLDIIADLVIEGQQADQIRSGPPLLLASCLLGSFIKPMDMAHLAALPAFGADLIRENKQIIADLAWAMLSKGA